MADWHNYIKPKSWHNYIKPKRKITDKKDVFIGRRFGKTRLTSIEIATLYGGEEGRKKAIEFWQKVDRGEE